MSLHPNPIPQDRSSTERRGWIYRQDCHAGSTRTKLLDQPIHQRAFPDARAAGDSQHEGSPGVCIELLEKLQRRVRPHAGFQSGNGAGDGVHIPFQDSFHLMLKFRDYSFDDKLFLMFSSAVRGR